MFGNCSKHFDSVCYVSSQSSVSAENNSCMAEVTLGLKQPKTLDSDTVASITENFMYLKKKKSVLAFVAINPQAVCEMLKYGP